MNSRDSANNDANSGRAIQPLTVRNGVLCLSGYGLSISVERGQLLVSDNPSGVRRTATFSRATSRLKRLVILGHSGMVTLDALRWLHGIGAAFIHIDADGAVIACDAPIGRNDPRLRRAQALAATNGVGLALAKDLVRRKIEAQRAVAACELSAPSPSLEAIDDALRSLPAADTPPRVLTVEAAAAAAYWGAWSSVEIPFVVNDAMRVPQHWRRFGSRASALTNSPRLAINPANAMLNYLYALLETECRIAALTLGLDPGLGVLHADQQARDSFALDLIEPLRPEIDRRLLGLVRSHPFLRGEFVETATGNCRLVPPLPELLAQELRPIARLVAPLAEYVARQLLQEPARRATKQRVMPTPLTEENRSAGRGAYGRAGKRRSTAAVRMPRLPQFCRRCGSAIPAQREYCDSCLADVRTEQLTRFSEAGPSALAWMRAAGIDPTKTTTALERQADRRREQRHAELAWERANRQSIDSGIFLREIQPRLVNVPLAALVAATGLSVRQCSRIRRGISSPHPRHWEALGALARS